MKKMILLFLFALMLNADNSKNVTIIYINDTSIDHNHSFPLTRDVYAKFIESLQNRYAPKVIYLNVTADYNDSMHPKKDRELLQSIAEHKNIVFTGILSEQTVNHHLYRSEQIDPQNIKTSAVESKGAYIPLSSIIKAGGHLGIYHALKNSAGYVTAFPFIYNIDKKLYPSALLKTVGLYKDLNISHLYLDDHSLAADNFIVNTNIFEGYYIPEMEYSFDTFFLNEVLKGEVDKKYIDGRIILLGIVSNGAKKTFPIASDTQIEVTEYLANAIESFLNEPKFRIYTYLVLGYTKYLWVSFFALILAIMIYRLIKRKRS